MTKNISAVVQEEDKNITNKSLPLKIILGVLLGVVLVGLIAKIILVKYYLPVQQSTNTPNTSLTPTPTILPIFQGKMTYGVSQGKTAGPKFSTITLDPQDPKIGETQKVTVVLKHTSPITSVKAVILSDGKIKDTHDLTLLEGNTLDGQWSGTWKIDKPHLYDYIITIFASDGTNESKAGVALR